MAACRGDDGALGVLPRAALCVGPGTPAREAQTARRRRAQVTAWPSAGRGRRAGPGQEEAVFPFVLSDVLSEHVGPSTKTQIGKAKQTGTEARRHGGLVFPFLQPGAIPNLPLGVERGLKVKGGEPFMPLCPHPRASSAEAARERVEPEGSGTSKPWVMRVTL